MTVMARTAPGIHPLALSEGLRTALLELDHELPPQSITTVEAAFRENTAPRRFAMTLVGGFGALALTLASTVAGVLGALVATRFIQGLLFGVSAVDLPTYLLTVGLITAVALLTALLPAARAARTDPVGALASD